MNQKMVKFVCLTLLILFMSGCGGKNEIEISGVGELKVFKQEITSSAPIETLDAGKTVIMNITVKNIGNETWLNKSNEKSGKGIVRLGYRWIDNAEKVVKEGRGMLTQGLMPGSSATIDVSIETPLQPGDYILEFSMVQESVAWFHLKGAEPLVFKVKVK